MRYANDVSKKEQDVAESSLTSRLRLAVVRLNRRLRAQRTSSSITLTQLSALFCLYKCGPLTPGELAAKEVVQPPSMTRVIAALEDLGYVSRRPHPSDGRQAIVEITEEGSAHIRADISAREAWLDKRLAELTDAERDLLSRAAEIIDRMASQQD